MRRRSHPCSPSAQPENRWGTGAVSCWSGLENDALCCPPFRLIPCRYSVIPTRAPRSWRGRNAALAGLFCWIWYAPVLTPTPQPPPMVAVGIRTRVLHEAATRVPGPSTGKPRNRRARRRDHALLTTRGLRGLRTCERDAERAAAVGQLEPRPDSSELRLMGDSHPPQNGLSANDFARHSLTFLFGA